MNASKNYNLRFHGDEILKNVKEKNKNTEEEQSKDNNSEENVLEKISVKFIKEQENQLLRAEKILDQDIDVQESDFKKRLKKKLENKKV